MLLLQSFYNRPTLKVAQELLGCFLCRRLGEIIRCKIVETEAYCGSDDKASHASKGRTERTQVMFGPPGYVYVYLVYGLHYMLNIATERKNYPAAVLIRAVEPVNDIQNFHQKEAPLLRGGGLGGSEVLIKTNQPTLREKAVDKPNLFVANGPAKLTKFLQINKFLNNKPIFTKKHGLWIESGEPVPPSQIMRAPRIGVDYAGEYKNKLWRFYLSPHL